MRARPGRVAAPLTVTSLMLVLLVVQGTPGSAASMFGDGFESGTLASWTQVVGSVSVQTDAPYAGAYYARAVSTGASAYLLRALGTAQPDLYVQSAVDVVANGGTLILLRLKSAAGKPLVTLKEKKNGQLQVQNHVAAKTRTSATRLPKGSWHLLQLHASVGSPSAIGVWLDGQPLGDLSGTESLGTSPVGSIQLGHNSSSSGFTVGFDEVAADTSFIGASPQPPSTPTGLAEEMSATRVTLTWGPVSNATGYDVYRDGSTAPIATVPAPPFTDTGLLPASHHSYSVDAVNAVGPSDPSAALDLDTPAVSTTTIDARGAGDIACDPNDPDFNGGAGNRMACRQAATSDLLTGADVVFAVGDTQYLCGGALAYAESYDPSWGRFKSITFAAPGDQEYDTSATQPSGTDCGTNASGYAGYFGARGGAGSPSGILGVYSVNLPEGCDASLGQCLWHVVALNSVCRIVGCNQGQPMEQWLKSDLAANGWAGCSLALLHVPRFASRSGGAQVNDKYLSLWQDLVGGGVDLVMSGNSHFYERSAPQDALGNADPNGTVQFVVGTGGRSLGGLAAPGSRVANSQAAQNTILGILQLTLADGSYASAFLPIDGGSFTDTSSLSCS
jgi:hypothetical protein